MKKNKKSKIDVGKIWNEFRNSIMLHKEVYGARNRQNEDDRVLLFQDDDKAGKEAKIDTKSQHSYGFLKIYIPTLYHAVLFDAIEMMSKYDFVDTSSVSSRYDSNTKHYNRYTHLKKINLYDHTINVAMQAMIEYANESEHTKVIILLCAIFHDFGKSKKAVNSLSDICKDRYKKIITNEKIEHHKVSAIIFQCFSERYKHVLNEDVVKIVYKTILYHHDYVRIIENYQEASSTQALASATKEYKAIEGSTILFIQKLNHADAMARDNEASSVVEKN